MGPRSPPIEVTDTILLSQSHLKGACGATGGRRHRVVGKVWKRNKIGRNQILTIDSHGDLVSPRFLTQTGRPNQTKHPQSDLRLHWISLTSVDGGPVRGRNKSKWAVSTDGCWALHPVGRDMVHSSEPCCPLEGLAEELWQHWGQLEGGGRAGSYDGKEMTPQGLLLRGDDTGNTERSTYVSRRIAVSTSSIDNDMVGTAQPQRPMDVTSTIPSPTGRPLTAMESLKPLGQMQSRMDQRGS